LVVFAARAAKLGCSAPSRTGKTTVPFSKPLDVPVSTRCGAATAFADPLSLFFSLGMGNFFFFLSQNYKAKIYWR
jgi:hypothetical protein